MNFCNSCRSVRVGENNNGDTIPEAMEGIRDVATVLPPMAYAMMESMLPQARKGGACQSCLGTLQSIKDEMARILNS